MSDGVQKSGRVGRPPSYHPEKVIAAARDLFWRRGLSETSYDELTLATGLHRPSIHAGFGNKRGLFQAALRRYLEDSAVMLKDALSQPNLANALAAFFAGDLALFFDSDGGRGCYALNVTAEAGRTDPELALLEQAAWRALSAMVAERINCARDHELPLNLDRTLVADLVLATHLAVATRARAGDPADQIAERVARFLQLFSPD